MIDPHTIRSLARAYRVRALLSRRSKVQYDDGCWTNDEVVVFEPPPREVLDHRGAEEAEIHLEEPEEAPRVWPVEIAGGCENYHEEEDPPATAIRFSDGDGRRVWVDARYLSTVYGRLDCSPEGVEWRLLPEAGADCDVVAAQVLGETRAAVAALSGQEEVSFDWAFTNEVPPAPRGVEAPCPKAVDADAVEQMVLF